MAEGGFDDYEMQDIKEEEQEEENNREEETNDDDDQRKLDNFRNLKMAGIGSGTVKPVDISGCIPDPNIDKRVINKSITDDKKRFIKDNLGLNIRVKDGPASKELLREIVVTFNVKGKPNGINYAGKEVVVSNDGGKTLKYSANKDHSDITNKFRILFNKAVEQHNNTLDGVVEQYLVSEGVVPDNDLVDNILSNSSKKSTLNKKKIRDQSSNKQGIHPSMSKK